jgi:hypothetical protein
MLNRIGTFTFNSAICLITGSLLSLPVSSSKEPQVPRLTLEIPIFSGSSLIYTDITSTPFSFESAQKLCALEGKATGRPYGFNKVRYIKPNNSFQIEIQGCITNNSTQTLDLTKYPTSVLSFESTISPIPPDGLQGVMTSEGKLLSYPLLPGPTIPPGQTRFFRTFFLPDYTNTATTIIKQASGEPGQFQTYIPVQQLNITILR